MVATHFSSYFYTHHQGPVVQSIVSLTSSLMTTSVSCILHQWDVHLILAYSWVRPAILAAGNGRWGDVFISSVSSLSFIFLSPLFLSFISSTISSIALLPFSGRLLAYSWARPAILVVGKGRGGMFLFLLFLHFHSCSSFFPVPLFHLLYSLLSLFSLSLGDDTK